MRFVFLLLAAIFCLPTGAALADGQRVPFLNGYFQKNTLTGNLFCELDSNTPDGWEALFTSTGDFQVQRCIGLGDTTGTYGTAPSPNCTGICRLGGGTVDADRSYADLNCNAAKDLGENFLDETGGNSSGDNVAVNGVVTSSSTPNFVGAAGGGDIAFSTADGINIVGTVNADAVSQSQLDVAGGQPSAGLCLQSTAGEPMVWGSCSSSGDNLGINANRGDIDIAGGNATIVGTTSITGVVTESKLAVATGQPGAGLCLLSTAGQTMTWGSCGSGGPGVPTSHPLIVADDPGNLLSAEVKPSATNQIPVSTSGTTAAWSAPTGVVGDGLFAGYQLPNPISPPLSLTNKLYRLALIDTTFDVFSFNTVGTSQLIPIEHDTWANVFAPGTGYCDQGIIDGGIYHLQQSGGDCTTAPSALPYVSTACMCGPVNSVRYGPMPAPVSRDAHYWTMKRVGWADPNWELSGPFIYVLDGAQYPRPLMRLQLDEGAGTTVQPGSCVATSEIGNLVTWTANRENTIHIKAQLNNPANNYPISGPRNKQMVSFVGWQRNYLDNSVGTNQILDPAGTTPATVMPTATTGQWLGNRNSIGLLWYGPTMTWYSVWHRDGVSRLYVVKTFTQGEYDTFLLEGGAINYFATWAQNGSGNADADSTGNKSVAWSAGVSEHNAYLAATATPGLGTPFQSGEGYRRVMASCALNSATNPNYNMHFMVQKMDAIR